MSLFINETGTPAAPTIIFLHGIGGAGWMWKPQLAHFNDYHCLIPDLPGHGKSHQEPWISLEATAAVIADLIRTRATKGQAHIVGLSLGAYIAAQLLSSEPDLVDHAILSGLCVLPLPRLWLMRVMGYVLVPLMRTRLFLRVNAKALHIPEEHYAEYQSVMRQMSRLAFLRASNDAGTFRMPSNFGEVKQPTLVLAGEREHPLIIESTKVVTTTLPHAVGRLAPDVGHGWSGENPALFNAASHAWINDLTLPHELLNLPGAAR